MPKNPPENMPRITPYLYYEDVATALDWLTSAFGFRERLRMPGPDGKITHAELELADSVIMMGSPGPDYQNPKTSGQVSQLVYVYVDDVDRHSIAQKERAPPSSLSPKTSFMATVATGLRIWRGITGTSPSTSATWLRRT